MLGFEFAVYGHYCPTMQGNVWAAHSWKKINQIVDGNETATGTIQENY